MPRAVAIWAGLAGVVAAAFVSAARSQLLDWRDGVYIAAGFAGIAGLAIILLQPLLAAGLLPGLDLRAARRAHLWLGALLVAMILAHVVGLFLTSPPDAIDALLFVSPTPFSPFGVIAMWACFATAGLAALRVTGRIRPRLWRLWHTALAIVIVICVVVHTMLVEGPMGALAKGALCALAVAAMAKAAFDLRAWRLLRRRAER